MDEQNDRRQDSANQPFGPASESEAEPDRVDTSGTAAGVSGGVAAGVGGATGAGTSGGPETHRTPEAQADQPSERSGEDGGGGAR